MLTHGGAKANVAHGARSWAEDAELGHQHRRRPGRIDVAPVRTYHLDAARRRRIDDSGLGRRYPGEQVRANPSRTKLSRTRLRTAPERSRVHPFAFARLRMAVSEAVLAPDPGPGDKSDRLRGVGQALIPSRTREGRDPRGCAHPAAQDLEVVDTAPYQGISSASPPFAWFGHLGIKPRGQASEFLGGIGRIHFGYFRRSRPAYCLFPRARARGAQTARNAREGRKPPGLLCLVLIGVPARADLGHGARGRHHRRRHPNNPDYRPRTTSRAARWHRHTGETPAIWAMPSAQDAMFRRLGRQRAEGETEAQCVVLGEACSPTLATL